MDLLLESHTHTLENTQHFPKEARKNYKIIVKSLIPNYVQTFFHCVTMCIQIFSMLFFLYLTSPLSICCIISNSPFLCFSLLHLLAYKDKSVFHSIWFKLSSQLYPILKSFSCSLLFMFDFFDISV